MDYPPEPPGGWGYTSQLFAKKLESIEKTDRRIIEDSIPESVSERRLRMVTEPGKIRYIRESGVDTAKEYEDNLHLPPDLKNLKRQNPNLFDRWFGEGARYDEDEMFRKARETEDQSAKRRSAYDKAERRRQVDRLLYDLERLDPETEDYRITQEKLSAARAQKSMVKTGKVLDMLKEQYPDFSELDRGNVGVRMLTDKAYRKEWWTQYNENMKHRRYKELLDRLQAWRGQERERIRKKGRWGQDNKFDPHR
jgi:hypothetical protein